MDKARGFEGRVILRFPSVGAEGVVADVPSSDSI